MNTIINDYKMIILPVLKLCFLRKTIHDIQLFLLSRDRDLLSRDRDLLSRDRDFIKATDYRFHESPESFLITRTAAIQKTSFCTELVCMIS